MDVGHKVESRNPNVLVFLFYASIFCIYLSIFNMEYIIARGGKWAGLVINGLGHKWVGCIITHLSIYDLFIYKLIRDKTYFRPYIFTRFPLWSLTFFFTAFSPYPGKCVSFLSLPLHQRWNSHS